MERHHQAGGGSESVNRSASNASEAGTLKILQRYVAGEISSRQAAKEMGSAASEHDVFAGVVAANLPLPQPPADDVAREVAALRALYGPHGPRPRG